MSSFHEKVTQESVIAKALSLGFFRVGFARAKELTTEADIYRSWLGKGYAMDMNYLEDFTKRTNPLTIFPRAKTVIMVALNYYQKGGPRDFAAGRYAYGADYHAIVKKKLDVLAKFIHGQDRKNYTLFCDNTPMMEKVWAVRAGIGWQGKNSLVITREAGSFFVLGGMLSSEAFLPSAMVEDGCGSCTRCIDACPQQAIVAPRIVDPGKCTGYWTVETRKKKIPETIAKNMGRWIFGCDICQLVCPYNKSARVTKENFGNHFMGATIREFDNISQEDFEKRFFQTPLWRRGRASLQKNIDAALKKY